MILTKEFLRACEACVEGYRFGIAENVIGLEYDVAITKCRELVQNDFADYLEMQKSNPTAVMFTGGSPTGMFVFNTPDTGEVFLFTSLVDALNHREAYKAQFMQDRAGQFVVNHIVTDGIGQVWQPVDLDTVDYEGVFAVFDPLTGLYAEELSLAQARTEWLAVKERFLAANSCLFSVHEELKNSEGWTAFREVSA